MRGRRLRYSSVPATPAPLFSRRDAARWGGAGDRIHARSRSGSAWPFPGIGDFYGAAPNVSAGGFVIWRRNSVESAPVISVWSPHCRQDRHRAPCGPPGPRPRVGLANQVARSPSLWLSADLGGGPYRRRGLAECSNFGGRALYSVGPAHPTIALALNEWLGAASATPSSDHR